MAFVVVGTVFIDTAELFPTRGRILIFEVEIKGKNI
jgi:hypothetical protein